MNIWFTSDWHFCHDKEFVWKARGFSSIDEMDEVIVQKHNSLVKPGDTVYCLGDCALNDVTKASEYMSRLNGNIIILIGNHDTANKQKLYNQLPNCTCQDYVTMLKFGKRTFYLSHYPTLTGNVGETCKPWCLHGHTHGRNAFELIEHRCYNVGMDAHDCNPVSLEEITTDIREYRNKQIFKKEYQQVL